MLDTPSGIAGFEGREPIAAAVAMSVKDPRNGAPSKKDRFHIMTSDLTQKEYSKATGGTYKAPARDLHPSFAAFNNLADPRLLEAHPDLPADEIAKRKARYAAELLQRRQIPARIAHVTAAECFELRLQTAKAKAWTNCNGVAVPAIPEHPKKGPVCIGNGEIANRWNGRDYERIPCPGEACLYSAKGPISSYTKQPEKAPCGPWMRFVARFDWPRTEGRAPLPNLVFKLTSSGWNTAKEFKGFFDAFERACRGFGVDPATVPLFEMPILITLAERRNMETSPPSVFPVASISMRGDIDLIAWIGGQLERGAHLRQLSAASPVIALTDRSQQSPEVLDADYQVIAAPPIAQPGQG